jgi:hypothetical protein
MKKSAASVVILLVVVIIALAVSVGISGQRQKLTGIDNSKIIIELPGVSSLVSINKAT